MFTKLFQWILECVRYLAYDGVRFASTLTFSWT